MDIEEAVDMTESLRGAPPPPPAAGARQAFVFAASSSAGTVAAAVSPPVVVVVEVWLLYVPAPEEDSTCFLRHVSLRTNSPFAKKNYTIQYV